MSTLKVTNIQATGETASRAVSGVAAMHCGFNMSANTVLGTATDTLSSQSFNASSFVDVSSGECTVALVNSMDNTGFTFLSGTAATNNTTTIGVSSTASSLVLKINDADSNTTNNTSGFVALMGDLA